MKMILNNVEEICKKLQEVHIFLDLFEVKAIIECFSRKAHKNGEEAYEFSPSMFTDWEEIGRASEAFLRIIGGRGFDEARTKIESILNLKGQQLYEGNSYSDDAEILFFEELDNFMGKWNDLTLCNNIVFIKNDKNDEH